AGGCGDSSNSMPKYVVSSPLTSPEWSPPTVLNGHVADDVSKLKQDVDGGILVAGSAQLATRIPPSTSCFSFETSSATWPFSTVGGLHSGLVSGDETTYFGMLLLLSPQPPA